MEDMTSSTTATAPRLLHDLQLALSSLYSDSKNPNPPPPLPSKSTILNSQRHHHHSFLIEFQTRNSRRRIQSQLQRWIDKQQQQNGRDVVVSILPDPGSSWLACVVALLWSTRKKPVAVCGHTTTTDHDYYSYEMQLFCAQTILHRLRRMKITEAVDYEMEEKSTMQMLASILCHDMGIHCLTMHHDHQHHTNNNNNNIPSSTNQYVTNSYRRYIEILGAVDRSVGQLMFQQAPEMFNTSSSTIHVDEQTIKAQSTVLLLASLAYQMILNNAFDEPPTMTPPTGSSSDANHHRPLLTTLAAALATAVFRWRYCCCADTNTSFNEPRTIQTTPASAQAVSSASQQPSLLQILYSALQFVRAHSVVVITMMDHPGTPNHHESCNNNNQQREEEYAIWLLMMATVSALPSTLFDTGGARGRVSVDPQLLQHARNELIHTDVSHHLSSLVVASQQQHHHYYSPIEKVFPKKSWILGLCTQWVKCLPLSMEFIQQIVIPLVKDALQNFQDPANSTYTNDALRLVVTIYEAAVVSEEDILAMTLGLSENNHTTSKKQSSRSRKRRSAIIQNSTTETMTQNVENEVILRGKVACHLTIECWNALQEVANEEFANIHIMTNREKEDGDDQNAAVVAGEGGVGCIAACANTVLPYILLHYSDDDMNDDVRFSFLQLFRSISQVFQNICSHPNRSVRALALEPLYSLHSKLLILRQDKIPVSMDVSDLERLVVEHFVRSSMNLASRCDYPPHYFDNLHFPGDESLEIERNDVRDLLRVVASGSDLSSLFASKITSQILVQVLHFCTQAINAATSSGQPFPETAIHAFSSMAKPVNHLAGTFVGGKCKENHGCIIFPNVVVMVLQILTQINQLALEALLQTEAPIQRLLPLTRIVNISNASYSPFLSAVASLSTSNGDNYYEQFVQVMHFAVQVSISSLEQIPELFAPSILDHSMYDIRGTMRGPGGEDHVGCLTLMRLVEESVSLAGRVAREFKQPRVLLHVCEVYQRLHRIEQERGKEVVHGRGATPQTRRILLRTLCQLEMSCQGQLGAASMLENLFNLAIYSVCKVSNARGSTTISEQEKLYLLAEAALDISAFSPSIVSSLFIDSGCSSIADEAASRTACLEVLTNACIEGYRWQGQSAKVAEEIVHEWNRLRAAIFLLIKRATCTEALSERGASVIVACAHAECEAARHLFSSSGDGFTSIIFRDEVVSPESVAAGLYIRLIAEILQSDSQQAVCDRSEKSIYMCIESLFKLKESVLTLVVTTFSTPSEKCSFDPRPTITEAWLGAMIELAESKHYEMAELLLVDTLVAIVNILFYKSMSSTRNERLRDPGMDLDGPHSLCIASFLASFFRLGPRLFQMAGHKLLTIIPIELPAICDYKFSELQYNDNSAEIAGTFVIGAALLRGFGGAFPPWVIELVPEIVRSLFEALGRSPEMFVHFFRSTIYVCNLSKQQQMQVPNSPNTSCCLAVQPGQLLAGIYFENMSEKAKSMFLEDIKRLSQQGDAASWRRMKVLIKQACGGKKEAEYNQKPAMTKWQFERI